MERVPVNYVAHDCTQFLNRILINNESTLHGHNRNLVLWITNKNIVPKKRPFARKESSACILAFLIIWTKFT